MGTHSNLRTAIVGASRQLFRSDVMSHSGHANLSARVDEGSFLITATGMVRELDASQLAHVGFEGEVLEGELGDENAEIVAMHSAVYARRQDVGAVIHTHSPSATAFALANQPLPCRHEPLLRFGQAETIPVIPWGPRGSGVSVNGIESALDHHPGTNAVLLANHGLLVFGTDPAGAAGLVVAVEESADAELSATALGGAQDLPAGALEDIRESMGKART